MTWLNESAGTVTQWAVEHTYDDGERRYFTDSYDEAETQREAEVANLNRAVHGDGGGSSPVSSRTVTYSEWT